jgi:GNAT superfamily N-acetyltransferase
MFTIRLATPDDVATIAQLKNATWQTDQSDVDLIASAITRSDHVSHIACVDESPAGFVSGFTTLSSEGAIRWEVDLLAVLSEYRGKGIAPQLIEASVQSGLEQRASLARALVAFGNTFAEKSFTRCGFEPDEYTSELYITHGNTEATDVYKRMTGHLISVETFSYRGVWVEEASKLNDFQFASKVISRLSVYGWHLAGAVIPTTNPKAIKAAEGAGYERVGQYRNWLRNSK